MSDIYCQCCRKHKKAECFPPTEAKNNMRRKCLLCVKRADDRNQFPNGIAKKDTTKIKVREKRAANSVQRFNKFLASL